jgi:hypothetical protein
MDPRFRGDDTFDCGYFRARNTVPPAQFSPETHPPPPAFPPPEPNQGDAAMAKAASALLVLALALGLAATADARHRRHHGGYDTSGWSGSGDAARAGAAELATAQARMSGGGGAFGAIVARLIRGCAQQADELAGWPYDAIAQIVGPDETQRGALDALRAAAQAAARRLSSDCPQDVPAAPSARLEAVGEAIDAGLAAFSAVEPPLQQLYAALDDEQKARLFRDMTLGGAPARQADRSAARAAERAERSRERWAERAERWERRFYRRRAYERESLQAARSSEMETNGAASTVCSLPRLRGRGGEGAARTLSACAPASAASANLWAGACENLAAVLRGWPIREIERGVRLTEPQRVAFYELVTASLKAADALASACPAETALTPAGRMQAMRARLAAVKAATAAIRPALVRFYEALDQGQKVRFAGMS